MKCKICKEEAAVALKSHNAAFCPDCYKKFFRRQLLRGIEAFSLFSPRDRILVAISGGKDSLALALELHEIGYDITGLFLDLAIPSSSDTARTLVEAFCAQHGLKLEVVELKKEGLAIPDVKRKLKRPVCSVCGKIKRHYFNRFALERGYDALATGHNLDDEASRLFSNTLRWDKAYLADQGPALPAQPGFVRKVKPLWRLTEFETACYSFLRGINYHWQPCPYSQGASFPVLKQTLNQLEKRMPGRKLDFYQGFLARGRAAFADSASESNLRNCDHCGLPTSSPDLCGVCRIREMLSETGVE